MSNEELLQPRYKVIADYPGNKTDIGAVIFYDNEFFKTPEGWCKFLNKYPAIYKPLFWYEERKVEDMPEYVKIDGKSPFKIIIGADIVDTGSAWCFEKNPDGLRHRIYFKNYVPSTEQEYNEYQSKQKLKA